VFPVGFYGKYPIVVSGSGEVIKVHTPKNANDLDRDQELSRFFKFVGPVESVKYQ
jgi:hypothetical protein